MTTKAKCAEELRRLATLIEREDFRLVTFACHAEAKTVRYLDGATFKVGTAFTVDFEIAHDAQRWT